MNAQLEPAPGRVPPSDLDAEAAVLSACMLDGESIDIVREILPNPRFMYADANMRILETAYSLQDKGQPVDIVKIAGVLRDTGRLDQIGGTPYLAQLADATPAVAHVADHAERVREKYRMRRMISICQTAAAEGYGDVGETSAWLSGVEQAVFSAAEERYDSDTAELVGPILKRVTDAIWERRDGKAGSELGVPCATHQMTQWLNGHRRGKMHVIAARPGMGKTSVALADLLATARAGYAAIFCSSEMDKEELVLRLLALVARVDSTRMQTGKLVAGDAARIVEAFGEIAKLPIAISFRPAATIAQIRSDVRRKFRDLRKKFGKDLVLGKVTVDYIQILDGLRQKGDTRETEVSNIAKGLTWMAGEFCCAVIALSQLNRELERRPDKRPVLSDLRESGAIEQDAYSITFLYRDEYYNKESADKGLIELGFAKNRDGQVGKLMAKFTAEYTRLDDLAREYEYLDDFERSA